MRKRLIYCGIAGALLGCAIALANLQERTPPRVGLSGPELVDCGALAQTGSFQRYVAITNTGAASATITRVATSCGCTGAVFDHDHLELRAGESARLSITVDPQTHGPIDSSVLVESEHHGVQCFLRIPVKAFVLDRNGLYVPPQERLVFGAMIYGETREKSFRIVGEKGAVQEILPATDEPNVGVTLGASADVKPAGLVARTVVVRFSPTAERASGTQYVTLVRRGEVVAKVPLLWNLDQLDSVPNIALYLGRLGRGESCLREVPSEFPGPFELRASGAISVTADAPREPGIGNTVMLRFIPQPGVSGIQSGDVTVTSQLTGAQMQIRWNAYFN